MLSLAFTVIKYVLGYGDGPESQGNDINEVIARIENANDSSPTVQNNECQFEEGCYYKTGYISRIATDYVIIDDCYMCENINVQPGNLKVGDKVYYLAVQKSQDEEQKVCKIISVVDEVWDAEGTTPEVQNTSSARRRMAKRNIIGKVTKREGRKVSVDPNNVTVDLDKISSEFVPIIGDWVQLESLVEVNEDSVDLSGNVLEINRIQPLRSKLDVGVVTSYNPNNGVGVIEKNIVFHKLVCESGYLPCTGDKVVSDSIESDQDLCTWRSLSVVPLMQVSSKESIGSKPQLSQESTDNLLENKHGVVISNDLKFNLNINEEKDLMVLIKNTSGATHVLRRGHFISKKAESQLSLVWPTIEKTTVLNPSDAISYTFKCKAKFVGTSEELFIFSFKGFKIGRIFRIMVNGLKTVSENNYNGNRRKAVYDPRVNNCDQMMYIPGIRPFKAPPFIKVRNGMFKVPQQFWTTVLAAIKENKSQLECEISVGNAILCLSKGLCFETYRERFHALLYLEEIAQVLDLQQYDIDSAVMRRCGDYLALQVKGLSEKRPSLLTGDRAIVSFKWDNSQGKLKYEGYIHKVTGTEIYLKFNEKFHQEYNSEDCQVTFQCSRTAIDRYHNAINLAVTHLGPHFLFPTQVIHKHPQVNLEEVETEKEQAPRKPKHNRKESTSSVCSNVSVVSTSDGSNSSIVKSPPRVSVLERLFNVKPIEPCARNQSSVESKQSNNTGTVDRKQNNKENVSNVERASAAQDNTELDRYISQIKKRKLIWFNKSLNYHQREAVRNILKGVARPLPYVIFGPPGTGKTITLCEAILQILTTVPESRLLVATPSNSSANLVAERLLDSGILKPGDLVRLIAHHCLDGDSIPERLLPYCATGELAASNRDRFKRSENGTRLNCTMSVLGRHRITVGTCTALGILYNMGFPRGHFSHIFVDEAGQATEPEIMIPLNFVHSDFGQVILAGDPLQLGPVVQSRLARHFGFGESFLTRLLHQFPYQKDPEGFETCYDPRLVTKLVMNYRSLPEILQLSNSLFYDSELQPQVSSKRSAEAELLRKFAADLPERNGKPPAIVFHGIIGTNVRDPDSPSWYNPEEATQVYLYLLKLYKSGLCADDIGIITPYQKQVVQIRNLLLELDVDAPKVSSVEGFQGQERKVIILSTVRSSNVLVNEDIRHALGFIASPRRLNVAITRARALLIIVGNPQLLAQDPYWRSVLIYCTDRDAYTGCNFIPSYVEESLTDTEEDANRNVAVD